MRDDLVQPTNLIELVAKAHSDGFKDGYQKALADLHEQVNGVPVTYNTITIALVNGMIKKLGLKDE